jgi:hypothetical protein
MKGVIADCLGKLVETKFGKEKWYECLEKAGLSRFTTFLAGQDIPDEAVMKVVDATCKVLNLTLEQAADAFGDYWVNDYAIKLYDSHYTGVKSAKDFLLKMDDIHDTTTKNVPNAHPPRFKYKWLNDKTLEMLYISDRGLIDFMVGLAKGVGRYFKEDLKVRKIGNDTLEITFS